MAQDSTAVYWFHFQDKAGTPYSLNEPGAFLSAKAIVRRKKQDIALRQSDLPVNPEYVKEVEKATKKVLLRSKWLNGVAALLSDSGQLADVRDLYFIDTGFRIKGTYLKTNQASTEVPDLKLYYGRSAHQIEMLNGHLLHQKGFKGEGAGIAVLDAGFSHVHELRAFRHLRLFNLLKGTYDFFTHDQAVFSYSNHGMYVLSVMAGYLKNHLMGAAPLSDYWLLRSENTDSEFLVEEYAWVAAAEYADSAGAKIINSSLGYTTFDDSLTDHRYASLDGQSTPVSRAASLAAQKGMLVVTSAGNEGDDPWQYISAPADADSVLTVGAVDSGGERVAFSGTGPTYDRRLKPDVVAQGDQVYIAGTADDQLAQGSGTSFSAPLVAGLSACLWQAVPGATNMQVLKAIKQSASHSSQPDTLTGYGIPDFYRAYIDLRAVVRTDGPDNHIISLYPNPVENRFDVAFYATQADEFRFRILDQRGKERSTRSYALKKGVNRLSFTGLGTLPSGVYLLTISGDHFYTTRKLIRQ